MWSHGTRRDIALANLNRTQFVPFKVYDVTFERRRPRGRPRDGVAKVRRKQLRITLDMRIDVVDDARGGHCARAWKSRNDTIASKKVVPVPVRDENRGKRPARAGDHIAECVDVFPDQQRVYENRVASSEDQRGCRRRKRSIGVACDYSHRTGKHAKLKCGPLGVIGDAR